jgi:hypothetical protein
LVFLPSAIEEFLHKRLFLYENRFIEVQSMN